jgi:hypothetical protein
VSEPFRLLSRLVAHPGMSSLVKSDPRVAGILDEPTRRALLAVHAGRQLPSGVDPAAVLRAATAVVLLLDRIAGELLEEQVEGLLRSLRPRAGPDQVRRVLEVTGWGGGQPRTLADVATATGVCRESVARARRLVRARVPRRPWLPALDAAGALLGCLAPVPADQAATSLRDARITDRHYDPAALLDLAGELGYRWQLQLVPGPAGGRIVSTGDAMRLRRRDKSLDNLRVAVLGAMRRSRVLHVRELLNLPALPRMSSEQRWEKLAALPGVVGLSAGWLGSVAPAPSSWFDRTLTIMLAVNPTLPISAVSDGLRRGMAARGTAWGVPAEILLEYLAHRDDVTINGDVISAVLPPAIEVVPAMERELVAAVRRAQSGMLRYADVVRAYTAIGGSAGAAQVYLARSPVLQRVGRGMYTARGDLVAPEVLGSTDAGL